MSENPTGDTIIVRSAGTHAVFSAQPVTRESYKRFLADTGRPVPRALTQPGSPTRPVTYVSQLDALAYCRWLGQRDGRPYRLPTIDELQALAEESAQHGVNSDIWAHEHGDRPEVVGGLKPIWLCEWTQETEVIERPGSAPRTLGSIFYPPWLREGNMPGHAQAHVAADEGYSFITFRVVYDRVGGAS